MRQSPDQSLERGTRNSSHARASQQGRMCYTLAVRGVMRSRQSTKYCYIHLYGSIITYIVTYSLFFILLLRQSMT